MVEQVVNEAEFGQDDVDECDRVGRVTYIDDVDAAIAIGLETDEEHPIGDLDIPCIGFLVRRRQQVFGDMLWVGRIGHRDDIDGRIIKPSDVGMILVSPDIGILTRESIPLAPQQQLCQLTRVVDSVAIAILDGAGCEITFVEDPVAIAIFTATADQLAGIEDAIGVAVAATGGQFAAIGDRVSVAIVGATRHFTGIGESVAVAIG